jgi:DNA-binding CsgD family transcriptional regulator
MAEIMDRRPSALGRALPRPSIKSRLSRLPLERQLPWYVQLPDSTPQELRPSPEAPAGSLDGLTNGELLALACAANGLTARQAGRRVHKSSDTIKTQLGAARLKLGARNTTHAVAIAMRRHLLVENASSRSSEDAA